MPERSAPRSEAQQPHLRHFVFMPGPSDRNRTGHYVLSFGLFVVLALMLQTVVEHGLVAASLDNPRLRAALIALEAKDPRISWRWLFLFFAISYTIIALALSGAVKLVHNRKALTLLTDRGRFEWRRALLGFLLYAAILVVPLLVYLAMGEGRLRPHFQPSQLAQLLGLSCLLFLIQTTTEEVLFRGYMTQFMASITDARAIIVLLPSLLFMFAHLDNPEVVRHPQVLLFYLGFGVFMSLIVLRERGLELAIGAHFANNLINSVVVRTDDGIFQTPAIFVLPSENLPLVVAFSGSFAPLVYWILSAIILSRR